MRRREEMGIMEKLYVIEVTKGTILTTSRMLRNLFFHLLHAVGLMKNVAAGAVISYPNERRAYPARYRGRHRLTLHDDGAIKCTSCHLCATACPAKCIYIEAAEHEDGQVEKFPHRYEIDTLLCIYCGYCVEACPVDAIRMDTGIHPEIYPTDPRMFIEDKEVLLQRSVDLAKKGQEGMFQEHLVKMQMLERKPSTREVY
jgi:NADH-quinone oxidoreductase subunit I